MVRYKKGGEPAAHTKGKVKIMEKNRYTVEQLINNVCEHNYRNSAKNEQKIRNCGFEPLERIHLFGRYYMTLASYHGGIRKTFYKDNREVKRETVLRALVNL